jgi:hypothetical protein
MPTGAKKTFLEGGLFTSSIPGILGETERTQVRPGESSGCCNDKEERR